MKIGFFGTSEYSVMTLEHLLKKGYLPSFVVTAPDRSRGRGMKVLPSPVKSWATEHDVPVIQPEKLRGDVELVDRLRAYGCDVFVVIAYGKIIPEEILEIPPAGSLNIHASLLPHLRGSCPIETAILNDEHPTGVTIIRMDALMDHGPIVSAKAVSYEPWPPRAKKLGKKLVEAGNELLTDILPDWVAGKIEPIEQDHGSATYTEKITKEDGLIVQEALTLEEFDAMIKSLSPEKAYEMFRKIQAYDEWPSCYFFVRVNTKKPGGGSGENETVRIKIKRASSDGRSLRIEKVIPEGYGEMNYEDLLSKPYFNNSKPPLA